MTETLFAQLVATSTGVLLLTAVLQMWRRSLVASIRLLVVQGVALAALVATLGVAHTEPEVVGVSLLVLAVKAVILPWILTRTAAATSAREEDSVVHPTAGLLGATALTMLAYVVSAPVVAAASGPAALAVPTGIALVLIGFLLLLTRHTALSQLIGFLVLDNGIAAVAFLTSGGLPLTVELGASLDVLLVILILRVLTVRMRDTHGGTTVTELRELHD
jgi:hydrogenase-4 component E